jgi:integrase/recombinase XerD
MLMKEIFRKFIADKRFIANLAPRTLDLYERGFGYYERFGGPMDHVPSDAEAREMVVRMRETPTFSVTTCNIAIRCWNSFFSWIAERGYGPHVKLPKLKSPKVVMVTFTDADMERILAVRPKRPPLRRAYTILCLLVDCGLRISEALTITKDAIDWTNLMIRVTGKGSKDRIVPMSVSLRKILWEYESRHRQVRMESPWLFCTRSGMPLAYRNVRRDFEELFQMAGYGMTQNTGFFHAFRRYFSKNYLRRGGNLIYLQQALGHSNIATTRMYVEVEMEDLRRAHLATSPLDRLKR